MNKKQTPGTDEANLDQEGKKSIAECPADGKKICPVPPDQCPCPGRTARINVMYAQEFECKRWALELHDNLLPTIGGLTLEIDAILYSGNGMDSHKAGETLIYLRDELKKSYQTIRDIIYDLRIPYEAGDLLNSIHSYAERLRLVSTMKIELNLPETAEGISSRVQVHIFRIIQEALLNAKKHASANNVRVYLEIAETHIVVLVEDDGCGFSPTVLKSEGKNEICNIGLISMQERAEMLGGFFELVSKPGCGTTVKVVMPKCGTMGSGLIWLKRLK